MEADGLDIAFLDKVNRELSTIYAVVLLLALLDGAIVACVCGIWLGLPWPLAILAGVALFVLTLAVLRATLLRSAARRHARALTAHARERGVETATLLANARRRDLTFVTDLVQRHGATGNDDGNVVPASIASPRVAPLRAKHLPGGPQP